MKDKLCVAMRTGDKITQYRDCEIKGIKATCSKCDFYQETNKESFDDLQMTALKLHLQNNTSDHTMNVSYTMIGFKQEGPDISVTVQYK